MRKKAREWCGLPALWMLPASQPLLWGKLLDDDGPQTGPGTSTAQAALSGESSSSDLPPPPGRGVNTPQLGSRCPTRPAAAPKEQGIPPQLSTAQWGCMATPGLALACTVDSSSHAWFNQSRNCRGWTRSGCRALGYPAGIPLPRKSHCPQAGAHSCRNTLCVDAEGPGCEGMPSPATGNLLTQLPCPLCAQA